MKRTYEFNVSITVDKEDEADARDRARELLTPKYPLLDDAEEREALLIWCYPEDNEEGFDPEGFNGTPEAL
jgi:hypothetical protein